MVAGWRERLRDAVFEGPPPAASPAAPPTMVQSARSTTATAVLAETETYRSLAERVFRRETGYAKLRRALEALRGAGAGLSEAQEFRAAIATLRATGLTPEEILRATAVHMQDLDGERRTFQQASAAETGDGLGAREKEAAALAAEAEKNAAEMERLRKRNEELSAQVATVRADVTARRERLAEVARQFDAAAEAIAAQIAADALRLKETT